MNFQEENIVGSYEEPANIDTNLEFFEQVNEWISDDNVYCDYDDDNYENREGEFGKEKKMKKALKKQKKVTKKLKREVKSLKADMSSTQSIDKIQSDVSFLKHASKKKLVSDNIHNIITEPDQRKRSKLIEDFADSIEEEF